MGGVSFLEVFGTGAAQAGALRRLSRIVRESHRTAGFLRLGVQPHAPYSCGLELYGGAARLGVPVATHLAETNDEVELIRSGGGPLAAFLERLGVDPKPVGGRGLHPVDHLADALAAAPFVAAHCNAVEDRHLERLARWGTTVVYCPRASAYFGHPPHRYLEMIEAGVNVALGTDGLLCLDTPDRISVLDEMRFLHRRDGTDPGLLLKMATLGGARGLGVDPRLVTLEPGPTAGLVAASFDPDEAIPPLVQVLERDDPPRWVTGPLSEKKT